MKYILSFLFLSLLLLPVQRPAIASESYDMSTTGNWNIRFDGPSASSYISGYTVANLEFEDLDNDGQDDIIIGTRTSNNSRANSGSVYVIYNTLFQSLMSTGNTVDLSNSSNYNLRFDGAAAGDEIEDYDNKTGDFDNDDKQDLIIGAYGANNSNKGQVYLIYNTLLDDYQGTGNNIDLSISSNYNIKFIGATTGDYLGYPGSISGDIDNDSKDDLIIGTSSASNNSRAYSGSIYVIYNSLIDDYVGTGNNVNISTTSNWNIRIDGSLANYYLSDYHVASMNLVDIDYDNKLDLIMGQYGYVFVMFNSKLDDFVGTGNTVDLATSSNWNLRFHDSTEGLSHSNVPQAKDIDGNGKADLLLGSSEADNNSRNASGSLYLFYDSLLDDYVGTGNTIEVDDTSKWNVRWDGPIAGGYLTYGKYFIEDMDGDGKNDIITGNPYVGDKLYVINNLLFNSLEGTGNTVDMATSSNYSAVYTGATGSSSFGFGTGLSDLNGDGKPDFLIDDSYTDFNSRSNSGSAYVIYNFPHTLTTTLGSQTGSTVSLLGNVSATNSSTAISGVQYQIDDNDPASGWTACTADDSSFNSTDEDFSCSTSSAPVTVGTHTVYIRAYDANTSYTDQENYLTYEYTIAEPTTVPTVSPTLVPSSSSAPVEETPQISTNQGGVFVAMNNDGGTSVTTIKDPDTFPFEAFIEAKPFYSNIYIINEILTVLNKKFPNSILFAGGNIMSVKIKGSRYWQLGTIENVWYKDFHNKAKILPSVQTKSSIIILTYTDADLAILGKPGKKFNPKNLKLGYSQDGVNWTILPTSVVDTINHTVAALHKIGGYYVILGR